MERESRARRGFILAPVLQIDCIAGAGLYDIGGIPKLRARVLLPLYLRPLNVSVPAPLFVRPPAPLITAAMLVLLAPEIVNSNPPLATVALLIVKPAVLAFQVCAAPNTNGLLID